CSGRAPRIACRRCCDSRSTTTPPVSTERLGARRRTATSPRPRSRAARGELIAAAVGSDSLATFAAIAPSQPRRLAVAPDEAEPEPQPLVVEPVSEVELDPKDEQDERDRMVVEEVARALDELTDARSIGRVLRDAV